MKLNLKKPIAFFDLETTGLNLVTDRIVEISILKVMPDGSEEVYTKRMNPTIPISAEASAITGIYDEDVKDLPTFKDLSVEIFEFLKGCDLGGYNLLRFDVPLLTEEFLRAEIEYDSSDLNIVDAQVIFHMMEKRTLSAAYKFYCDKELDNAHSAEADVRATYDVLKGQIERYEGVAVKDGKGNESIPVQNDMKALTELAPNRFVDSHGRMVWKNGVEVFNFGKHKNKPVKDVLLNDKGYYDWIMKGEFALSTKMVLRKMRMQMLKDSF